MSFLSTALKHVKTPASEGSTGALRIGGIWGVFKVLITTTEVMMILVPPTSIQVERMKELDTVRSTNTFIAYFNVFVNMAHPLRFELRFSGLESDVLAIVTRDVYVGVNVDLNHSN